MTLREKFGINGLQKDGLWDIDSEYIAVSTTGAVYSLCTDRSIRKLPMSKDKIRMVSGDLTIAAPMANLVTVGGDAEIYAHTPKLKRVTGY